MECYTLSRGKSLWVSGPSRVTVKSGVVLGSGVQVTAGEELVVRSTRGLTLYSIESEASVCVYQGSGASARIVEEDTSFVVQWLSLARQVESMGAKSIVVIGAPETGKSTLALWLANQLGLNVVEGDIGQNEFGQPTCISYAFKPSGRVFFLQDFPNPKCIFAGHVSAEKVVDTVISSILEASRIIGSSYVVDTDGFIQARGLSYKLALVNTLNPDIVVFLGPESSGIVRTLQRRGYNVLVKPPLPHPRERSRLDRRVYRSQQWARLFSRTRALTVPLDIVSNLCDYTVVEDATFFDCPHGRFVVSRKPVEGRGYRLKPGWEKGIVAGVMVGRGEYVLALVERINTVEGKAIVNVPEEAASIEPRDVVLGWVKLGENFTEEHLQPTLHPETMAGKRLEPS